MMTHSRRQNDLLIVFGKAAVPGRVKTRLVPPLTDEQAAELNRAFMLDLIARQRNKRRDLRLCLSTVGIGFEQAAGELADGLAPDVDIRRQIGSGLGARMRNAFFEAFEEGYGRVVILGSDHPSYPDGLLDNAFDALGGGPVTVLGPATDGGYCLIGMDRVIPEAFTGMTYSHDRVLRDTLDRLRAAGVRTVLLDEWYDVDDERGLARLADDLATGRAGDLPRTRRLLQRPDIATGTETRVEEGP